MDKIGGKNDFYYALRDEREEYQGTLEVTHEISDIQSITGEKRILDWKE